MKLHHIAIVCSSIERADRFYEGVLGLKKIKSGTLDRAFGEQLFGISQECEMILYGNEDFRIEVFVTVSVPKMKTPYQHICLEVKDRQSFAEKCEQSGLIVKRFSKGDYLIIFIEDYDGNLFEIKESMTE
ncbi:MAG: VOC family protein [Desulfobacterales bacterium]|jgi:catechol 2,3-dioxygenase-like lactoylglutathione lyase family enzyme